MVTETELRRMHKLAQSPMISLASEMINGSVVIRQFGFKEKMMKKFYEYMDLKATIEVHEMFGHAWMGVRVKHLTFGVVALSVFGIALNKTKR